MRPFARLICLLGPMLVVTTDAAAVPITSFSYTSSPTSFVGRGLNERIEQGSFWVYWLWGGDIHARIGYLPDDYLFFLDLYDPFGGQLSPGFYDALQLAEHGEPGFAFGARGRGTNRSSGYFEIHEVEYLPDNSIERLAVDFTYYEDGDTANWVKGKLRYNSLVPEPSTLLMAGFGLAAMALRVRNCRHHAAR